MNELFDLFGMSFVLWAIWFGLINDLIFNYILYIPPPISYVVPRGRFFIYLIIIAIGIIMIKAY